MMIGIGSGSPAAAGPAPVRVTQHTSADGVAHYYSTNGTGDVVLTAATGELVIEKTVSNDGRTSLLLRAGVDEVRVHMSEEGVAVTAGRKRHRVQANAEQEDDAEAVRVALAKSRAVRLFRFAASAVEARDAASPYDEAMLLSGAVVAQLAGGPGAIRALTRRGNPGAVGSGLRPASTKDCRGDYERDISRADHQYLRCLAESGRLLRMWSSLSWCDAQYVMRCESAWFKFLARSSTGII